MNRAYAHVATVALLGGLLAACAAQTATQSTRFVAPQGGDEGVVIAESRLVPGVSRAASLSGGVDDCVGPGLGIQVGSSTGEKKYLFDKGGELCDGAQTLFDGRLQQNARAADPTIQLTLHDAFGPLPATSTASENTLPPLKALPTAHLQDEDILDPRAIEPAAGPAPKTTHREPVGPDPLVATLTKWRAQDGVSASRSAEADQAAERALAHVVDDVQAKAEAAKAAQLASKLRERERQLEEERRRQAEILSRAEENRAMTESAKQAWDQKETQLQAELAATRQRLAEYQALSSSIASEKAQKEAAYQEKISALSKDLKTAEAQASESRRDLILKAAAKIAEAEQLAHAAKLEEQDIKLREAARLKAEAQTALDHALAMKAGEIVTTDAPAPVAAPLALMETPVVIHAKDLSLAELLNLVLKQAEPQAGAWKADWQLSGANQYILKEKWSLTAEAPVKQVLDQINAQVKDNHKQTLVFTQFNQSRLLVVTDTPTK